MTELRNKILLCVICIVVGLPFAWWIAAEVVSDIEAKDGWSPCCADSNEPIHGNILVHEQEVEIIE